MRARWLLLAPLLLTLTSVLPAQQWFSVQTDHLISYSEGNDRGARETALRGEQLIAVFEEIFHRKDITFATPLCVLAIHAPPPADARAENFSTLARTPATNFVTVDLQQPGSWTEAARAIAALTLEDNYPRAQPWFDHGIASYLAGVRFSGDHMELGAPPPGMVLPQPADWIPLAQLLETTDLAQLTSAQQQTFEAESWVVMRWIIGNSRLAQAGAYLNSVQSRGASPERALIEAFSMGSADLDRELRESMGKLAPKSAPAPRVEGNLLNSRKVSAPDAYVLKANLSLFGSGGDETLKQLIAFMRENQQNAAAHRSLAWAFLLRHDLENAVEHIRRALELDDADPTMHYLYARWVNQGDEDAIRLEHAGVRMGTELKAALRRDPNYAAALELLGLAQLNDGAAKDALPNLQRASSLRPRSNRYYLNLALAYEASGNLEAARNLMLYARAGSDATVSAEAGTLLNEIGKQKKKAQQWESMGLHPDPNAKPNKYDNLDEAIAEDEAADAKRKSPESAQDTRKIEHMKGRIIGVECASTEAATLTISSAGRVWKIHVADRNKAVLIGVEQFDCGWRGTAVSVNYKRGGNLQGDLVSLEADAMQ